MNELTLSEIKAVKEYAEDDWREAVQYMIDEDYDFEVNNYRFIRKDSIDEIMQDELASDEYVLGCFNAGFLADVLDIDITVIEAMQEAEASEAIGKLIMSMDKLEKLQADYVAADGYGHHFNRWDGSEHEVLEYYVFRIN